MEKKRIIISVAVILGVCILMAVGVLLNELFGNPVSKFLVKRSVSEYLEGNYSDSDFVIEKVGYDFKGMHYYAKIVSSTDSDEYFYITTDSKGKNIDDNYDLYFDESGKHIKEVAEDTETSVQKDGSEKNYIDTLDSFDYHGPFGITTDPGECNNKFFVCDRSLEHSDERATLTFGITYTDAESNLTETVAVVSADYNAEYENFDFDVVAKIIASNQKCVIFEVCYPPCDDSCSYYYNMKTNDCIELQGGAYTDNEWYVFEDMFVCTTTTLAVGTEMDLYAYNWNGDLLYTRENILSGYTISDGWVYFADETIENESDKRCTVYKMRLDGAGQTEYYSVSIPINTDFVILDNKINWWENGEKTSLDLFTLQPID